MEAKGCKWWNKKNAVKKLDTIWGLGFWFVCYPILCAELVFRQVHLNAHTGNNYSFFLFSFLFTWLYQIGVLSHTGSSTLHKGECPVGLDTITICCSSPAYKFLHSVRSRESKHLHLLAMQYSEICTESSRLEKTSKIIKSNHLPNTTMPAKPCPQVQYLHVFWTPPGTVTPPLPWAAWPLF